MVWGYKMTKKVVIVGAGPAGISAAAELSSMGIKTTVIDEAPKVGGVIYRGPWRKTQDLPHLDDKLKASMKGLEQKYLDNMHNIHVRTQTRVLGPVGESSLLTLHKDKAEELDYDYLLLATGCHERSVPFSGWQLPGVMLMGGIQLQLKSGLVRPGNKVVLVGTGPLLVLIACQLHKAGCEVIGIYEATSFNKIAKEALALMNRPQLALDGMSMMLYLKRNNIPFHYGWGIVEAEGKASVESVTVAPYDSDWKANFNKSVTLEADTLGVGYGFTARSQLAQLLQLDVSYDYDNGTIPVVDDRQKSSVDHIYCAGDTAKLAGADGAMLEGVIAAKSIAAKLLKEPDEAITEVIKGLRKDLSRVYRFRGAFDRSSKRQVGLLDLPKDDTTICRCEQVKKRDIDNAIAQGCRDIVSLKMKTRITMGDCQGKTCSSYCYDRLASAGFEQEQGLIRPRFPLDPIPFSAMVD